jgi:hypothetical protein
VSQPDPTGESPVTTAKPPARYGALDASLANRDHEHLGGRGLTYGAEIAADLDFKIRE